MSRVVSRSAQKIRPASSKETDASALRAIAQATVNVELFTVPLYMGTLYSIQGMHQITGKDEDFYRNRRWPGAATTASPRNANERAFNLIYSVFVEEMLHIQLAANIASAVGVTPTFTSNVLQDDRHGWTCYGPHETVIPHIIDLRDTTKYHDVKVNIAALGKKQVELFMAIEEPEKTARHNIKNSAEGKYFPSVPFAGWTKDKTERDLPMFGTIGWMYQCYYDYLSLRYDDGTDLWQYLFKAGSLQKDLFNTPFVRHPEREYVDFDTVVAATDQAAALDQVLAMMNAITDQGEGSELNERAGDAELLAVLSRYQASRAALEADYPSYNDTGQVVPSADAVARYDNGVRDHFERFTELSRLVPHVQTWPRWRDRHPTWTAEDLQTEQYDPADNPYQLPSTTAIADAMNRVAQNQETRTLVNMALMGAITGVTTALNQYWTKPDVPFPFPSMVGSGDRMAVYWALFGAAPDLSLGVGPLDPSALYHSCQGLDFTTQDREHCAAIDMLHACKGSNQCKAQGGCGFVQVTTPGNGGPPLYSAPSDNKCRTFGGCAVPISASQILPQSGTMQVFDFVGEQHDPEPLEQMPFNRGEKVHDVAYRAYQAVMKKRQQDVPEQPPDPNDRRLVFPPST